jgi:hypothetical protein
MRTSWASWAVSWEFLFPFRASQWRGRRVLGRAADSARLGSTGRRVAGDRRNLGFGTARKCQPRYRGPAQIVERHSDDPGPHTCLPPGRSKAVTGPRSIL